MKKALREVFYGKNSYIGGIIAIFIITTVVLGCNCNKLDELAKNTNSSRDGNPAPTTYDTPIKDDKKDGTLPSDSEIVSLVKETTADFSHAVDTEDFAEIYKKSSRDFQSTYEEPQMKEVFKTYIQKKRVVLPSLEKTVASTIKWDKTPTVRSEKGLSILVAHGTFQTKPFPVKFEYEYVFRDGTWKMLKLYIKM